MTTPMDTSDLSLRLEFMRLTAEDRERLAELEPLLEEHSEALVEQFYSHLLAFEPTSALLRSEEVRDRLLAVQREYLLSLATSDWDESYVKRRIVIGNAHERVGLEPRWYLGAYSLYIGLLCPLVHEAYPQPARARHRNPAIAHQGAADGRADRDGVLHQRPPGTARLSEQGTGGSGPGACETGR